MPVLWPLTRQQADIEERIRTASLFLCGMGVLACFLYFFRPVLIPFVLALALKHLLEPIVRLLSIRPLVCFGRSYLAEPLACRGPHPKRGKYVQSVCDMACRLQLPRKTAILVSFLVAFAVLAILAAIVANSVHVFAGRADEYAARVKDLLGQILGWIEWFSCSWTPAGCQDGNATGNGTTTNTSAPGGGADAAGSELQALLSQVPLADLVLKAVESLLELLSNLFVVALFTAYLLLGNGNGDERPTAADQEIYEYIKCKVALSSIVGAITAVVLLLCGLDLWLVFGVLAFWLNFIPNVGAVVAVLLPMPLVLLDSSISTAAMVLAFLVPFCAHMLIGNVFEPLLFGHSLHLQPVVILLSLMVWGMLWGLVGMVLAVPITAVLKIHLSTVDHPFASYLLGILVGAQVKSVASADPPSLEPAEDTLPLHACTMGTDMHACTMGTDPRRSGGGLESATRPLVVNSERP